MIVLSSQLMPPMRREWSCCYECMFPVSLPEFLLVGLQEAGDRLNSLRL